MQLLLASVGIGLAQSADTLTVPLRPIVAPADTLVRIVPCPGVLRAAVGTIIFAGNAVTKERILRAELDFDEGDTLTLADLPARLEANRSRLFNLQLFHAVVAQASLRYGPAHRRVWGSGAVVHLSRAHFLAGRPQPALVERAH
ncbi:POTRA domain-containing protein [Hymenobacter humi]|uniref:POTRA domain-containing protein n=1 Tax=Hymenobacter humi TaxID=1411620 RepID=A0ABW2U1N6_9BACT